MMQNKYQQSTVFLMNAENKLRGTVRPDTVKKHHRQLEWTLHVLISNVCETVAGKHACYGDQSNSWSLTVTGWFPHKSKYSSPSCSTIYLFFCPFFLSFFLFLFCWWKPNGKINRSFSSLVQLVQLRGLWWQGYPLHTTISISVNGPCDGGGSTGIRVGACLPSMIFSSILIQTQAFMSVCCSHSDRIQCKWIVDMNLNLQHFWCTVN